VIKDVVAMLIRTTRFGALSVDLDDLITFPGGLLGFEDCRLWALLSDASNDALGWLQCTTRGDAALAVVSPRRFIPNYQFRASRRELAPLELPSLEDAQVLAIVSEQDGQLTLNLKAPIVINLKTRTARQIVVNDEHPLQFLLPSGPARMKKSA
jgi:flagellar assembly factor FliW